MGKGIFVLFCLLRKPSLSIIAESLDVVSLALSNQFVCLYSKQNATKYSQCLLVFSERVLCDFDEFHLTFIHHAYLKFIEIA